MFYDFFPDAEPIPSLHLFTHSFCFISFHSSIHSFLSFITHHNHDVIIIIIFLISQAEEEVRALQKKIQQVENELDQVQENLGNANSKLDEKDKALQVVSTSKFFIVLINLLIKSHYKSTRDSHQQNYIRNREDTSLLFHSFFNRLIIVTQTYRHLSTQSVTCVCLVTSLFSYNEEPIVRCGNFSPR